MKTQLRYSISISSSMIIFIPLNHYLSYHMFIELFLTRLVLIFVDSSIMPRRSCANVGTSWGRFTPFHATMQEITPRQCRTRVPSVMRLPYQPERRWEHAMHTCPTSTRSSISPILKAVQLPGASITSQYWFIHVFFPFLIFPFCVDV